MTTTGDRRAIAKATAESLEARRAQAASTRVVAGFDAMIDSILRVVDTRSAPGPKGFVPMARIEQFAQRVAKAAGKSINIEFSVERVKIGGNGVLMADGLSHLGARVTFIGNLGAEDGSAAIHPLFAEFASRCERACVTSPPGFTDAAEFDDGKVMLGKTANLATITWESVCKAAGGLEALTRALDGASLLVPVSWTQVPSMDRIWAGLIREAFPTIAKDKRPGVFIDLADPAKRTEPELIAALALLREMNESAPVALGLNLSESQRIARAVGLPEPTSIAQGATAIRQALGLACVVVHNRQGAAGATPEEAAEFDGPFVAKPKMSTGAGDHFNAGFSLGWRLGLPVSQALALGTAVSGLYVREAVGPSMPAVCAFLRDLPDPER